MSLGRTSLATSVRAFMASPELKPGAALPVTHAERKRLKRFVYSGPKIFFVVVTEERGTMSPSLFLT